MRYYALLILLILGVASLQLASSDAQTSCIIANYFDYRQVMRPGESGHVVAVYIKNLCSEPTDLILRLIMLDDEPTNDVDLPVNLKPGEEQIVYGFVTFVPRDYEEKYLPFYVEFYQNVRGAYTQIGYLPTLNITVFPDFEVTIYTEDKTVKAGEKILISVKASEETTSSHYNLTVYFVSGIKRLRIQVIELQLDPDKERKIYLDVPSSTVPGDYDLHLEVWKGRYRLSESDPETDPRIKVLPATGTQKDTQSITVTQTTTAPTSPSQTHTETPEVPTKTQEMTESPQTTVKPGMPAIGNLIVMMIMIVVLAVIIALIAIFIVLRRERSVTKSPGS
ncbi:MAG: hypothetical protein NZ992_07265 [Candidatus Korarchaeum sp.]|nr:hypothetical protein [Candidatus Korarchaeum sp.]MDW8035324.1 hypothetical protein [Candidatus Korarchaeum sp.]